MAQVKITPKSQKVTLQQDQEFNIINQPLIFRNNHGQVIMINQLKDTQKAETQNKNYDLEKICLDQSTQIQNQSNIALHPLCHPLLKVNNSNQTNKQSSNKGQRQIKTQQSKFHGLIHPKQKNYNQMFKVKTKQKSKGRKCKETYDELTDKNLIQYLYTRQNKIFQEQEQTHSQYQAAQSIRRQSSHKIKRNSPNRLANILRFDKNKTNKPFTIRKDCGRKEKYTIFDAISREQSIKQNTSQKYKTIKSNIQLQKIQKQNKNELAILKQRIGHLEESVYHKVPFLLEMGVKFKFKN